MLFAGQETWEVVMARLNGPLFSLGASGKLADALVYGSWKGIKTVRQYVIPANPQTAGQVAQRALVTAAVSAWKNYFTDAEAQAAWDRHALNESRPMSGFNSFMSQLTRMMSSDADCSFCDKLVETAGNQVTFETLNADDGAAGDEAGDFEIWAGSTVSSMTLNEEVAIAAADVVGTNDLGTAGDIVYVKLRKGGYDRSGIFAATLID